MEGYGRFPGLGGNMGRTRDGNPACYRASGTDKAITDYTRLAGEMTNLRDRFRHAATIDSYKSFAEFDAATKPLLDRS